MAYGDGTLNLSGNLNVAIGKPLDARYSVEHEADITSSSIWSVSGANYAYEGIMVYCKDTHRTMQLQGSNDYSIAANWIEIGGNGSGTNPVGTLIWFGGSTAPSGYLLCNGDAVSRTTYSALFAVIGTAYGAGDESTTFNLPNLIDKFIEGSATAGMEKEAGLPEIAGRLNLTVTGNTSYPPSGPFYKDNSSKGAGWAGGNQTDYSYSFSASRVSSIYGKSTTVQPPALTALPCIKY